MAHIGFAALVKELEAKGHSPESARRIAAAIGRRKYGVEKFAHMSALARAKRHKAE